MSTPPAYWSDETCTLLLGDALDVLREMPDASADCCVTSPPYLGQRDYGSDAQIGLEDTPADYVARLAEVFSEVLRVLADGGTLWLNIGDKYAGSGGSGNSGLLSPKHRGNVAAVPPGHGKRYGFPAKSLLGLPWRVAISLQDVGWIWRNVIPWHKTNAMPDGAQDRLSSTWEPVLMMSKSRRYHFDLDAISVPLSRPSVRPGRNAFSARDRSHPRSTTGAYSEPSQCNPGDFWEIEPDPFDQWWDIATTPYPGAHMAPFPVQLPIRCIKTTRPGATVLDPFSGAGTTGEACRRLGRKYVGIDLNPAYHDLAVKRYAQGVIDFTEATA